MPSHALILQQLNFALLPGRIDIRSMQLLGAAIAVQPMLTCDMRVAAIYPVIMVRPLLTCDIHIVALESIAGSQST